MTKKGKNIDTTIRYDQSLHRIARAMFEMEGRTLIDIGKDFGISPNTLTHWKRKEKWLPKGSESKKIDYITRELFQQQLIEQGMPSKRATNLLIQGMSEPVIEQVIGVDSENKPIIRSTPDYNTRQKYQKDYWKMNGLYDNAGAKESLGIQNSDGGTINIQVNLPELNKE
tara:strand:- start:513 stop:1022 length:510 start_codon:yes stop_codon:yes gene_type:complete